MKSYGLTLFLILRLEAEVSALQSALLHLASDQGFDAAELAQAIPAQVQSGRGTSHGATHETALGA
jgi:hypothetical protein